MFWYLNKLFNVIFVIQHQFLVLNCLHVFPTKYKILKCTKYAEKKNKIFKFYVVSLEKKNYNFKNTILKIPCFDQMQTTFEKKQL